MSSSKRSKGIVKPGYHIEPKYDLAGLRRRQARAKSGHGAPDLPLVSLIDMFTILVIYLLMNFSATGEIFFMPKELKLPQAKHTHPLESAPLITVTDKETILETDPVGENPITVTESNAELPRLAEALSKIREFEMQVHPGQPFKGQLNIQADESTPLVYIKRVMQTCILGGWTGINFAVRGLEHQ